MQGLHYRAIDEQGKIHLGFMMVGSQSELQRGIAERGWQPLPISFLQKMANKFGISPPMPNWRKADASVFYIQLGQLLDACVPLLHAMHELAQLESSKAVRDSLLVLTDTVKQGKSIADSMAMCPSLFANECVAAVRAGEASGQLTQCLAELGANLRWQSQLAEKLKTVLAYPAFALSCLVGVFLFVLLYLVPAMLPLLSEGVSPLPVHTRVLLLLSDFMLDAGIWIIVVPFVIVLLIYVASACHLPLAMWFSAALLNGSYGKIRLQFALARYARSVSLLYESGVEITESMKMSEALIGFAVVRQQLSTVRKQVLAGDSIAEAMRAQSSLPTLFVRMIAAGEYAGVLGVSFRQGAEQLQGNAQYSLNKIERLIGPVLLCVMGAMLLWVALSILGPIYSAVGQAGMY